MQGQIFGRIPLGGGSEAREEFFVFVRGSQYLVRSRLVPQPNIWAAPAEGEYAAIQPNQHFNTSYREGRKDALVRIYPGDAPVAIGREFFPRSAAWLAFASHAYLGRMTNGGPIRNPFNPAEWRNPEQQGPGLWELDEQPPHLPKWVAFGAWNEGPPRRFITNHFFQALDFTNVGGLHLPMGFVVSQQGRAMLSGTVTVAEAACNLRDFQPQVRGGQIMILDQRIPGNKTGYRKDYDKWPTVAESKEIIRQRLGTSQRDQTAAKWSNLGMLGLLLAALLPVAALLAKRWLYSKRT